MFAWQATVQDELGNAVPLPVVTVYQDDGVTLASIFTEAGAALPNPLTGNMQGFVQFWADEGEYKVEGASGGQETETWEVTLGFPELPLSKFATAGVDATAGVNAWLAKAAARGVVALVDKSFRPIISGVITVPNGVIISGDFKLTTPLASGVAVNFGDDVTLDDYSFFCTSATAASHTHSSGINFKVKSIYAEALTESNGTFWTFKNQGLNVGRMHAFRWCRPWNLDGTGGAAPMIGGTVGYMSGTPFIRGLSINFADMLNIKTISFSGRAAGALQQPGHNGVLIQGSSGSVFGSAYIKGAAEHAWRIGGSPAGSANDDCSLDSLVCHDTGGCDFKSNDSAKYSNRWYIGSVVGRRNFTPATRNTECVRLNKTNGYRFGSINAQPTGELNSCISGIQVNSSTWLTIDDLNIKGAAGDIIRFDDTLDEAAGPTTGVRIGRVFADGAARFMEIKQETQSIGDIVIQNIVVSGSYTEFVKRGVIASFTGPIRIGGTVLGSRANTGILPADPFWFDLDTPEVGRGSTADGDWVRLADGTLIITRICDVNVTASTSQAFNNPVNFASGSTVGCSVGYLTSTPNAALQMSNIRAYGNGGTSFFFRLLVSGTSTAPGTAAERVVLTAVGRWK